MPFFFSGFWMMPMFVMPFIFFLVIYFLYKKGFLGVLMNTFNNHQNVSKPKQDYLLENNDKHLLEIIKLRYANGEISTDEYRELKQELIKYNNPE